MPKHTHTAAVVMLRTVCGAGVARFCMTVRMRENFMHLHICIPAAEQ